MAFLRTKFLRSPISVMSCMLHFLRDPVPFTQRKRGLDHPGQCRDNLRESPGIVSAKACHDCWAAIHAAIELVFTILIQPGDDCIVPPVADADTRYWISLHVIRRIMKDFLAFPCHVGKPDGTGKDEHAMCFCERFPQLCLCDG